MLQVTILTFMYSNPVTFGLSFQILSQLLIILVVHAILVMIANALTSLCITVVSPVYNWSFLYNEIQLLQSSYGERNPTNKVTCTHSEDSDQPGNPHSLISVFAMWSMSIKDPQYQADFKNSDQSRQTLPVIRVSFCLFCHEIYSIMNQLVDASFNRSC